MQTALAPPTGPVFLSLPVDLQAEVGDLDLTPARPLDTRVRPPIGALQQAAELLARARNPGILVGSRTVEADAVAPLVRVAELLGAPAMSESGTTHGRLGFPADHPLSAPGLPLWSPQVRERLDEFDVLLVVGMDLLRQYVYHEPARAIPEHIRLVHLDPDPWQLGKNYPVEVGLVGDLQAGLEELAPRLERAMSPDARAAAAQRGRQRAEQHAQARVALAKRAADAADQRPLAPLPFMATLARVLPPDVAVVEEAVTTTNTYLERLGALRNCLGYFGHRGWALGWGLGCAVGVQLAWPDRPVLAILGEGAALYGIQGLWSAAKYRLPVTFVIANNAQYQILKIGARQMGLPEALEGRYVGLDLTEPEVDLVGLAQSFGIEARRIGEPEELADCVRAALASDRPHLIDVPIGRPVPGALAYS
jgi:benzoylformate decarboxylase